MKKICSLFLLLLCLGAHAQITVDDFESGVNNGWVSTSGMGYTAVTANEYQSGINLSNYVLYAQRAAADDNWAGTILKPYVKSGYKYLHAYMYRNNSGIPNLKVSDTNAQDLLPMNSIVANQWQDVVWDISDYYTSGTEFIMFMVDRSELNSLAWVLIDEIALSNDPTPRTDVVGKEEDKPIDPNLGDYKLVWSDEFDGSALNRSVWNIEVNGDGGGNSELQYYCEKGVSVADGCLILTATKENYQGRQCTSGRINSLGNMYFTYGRVDARIKMPSTANGLWPAYWMMGNDFSQVGWPACGEIDIVEMGNANGINAGTQDRYFNGAYHWGTRWDDHRSYAQDVTYSYSVQDGEFHLFSCVWTPEKISMYVDLDKYPSAQPYCVMTIPQSYDNSAPGYYFHKPNFVIFNLAVGGNFPAIWDINSITAFANGPRSMYVDYVRVYQRGDAGESFYVNPQTGIENLLQDQGELLSTEYYNLQGQQVEPQTRGVVIRRQIYSNGEIKIEKLLK